MRRFLAWLLRRKSNRYFQLTISEWDDGWYVDIGHYENGYRESGNLSYPRISFAKAFEDAMGMCEDERIQHSIAKKWDV